jgi:hypothetical protein
MLKAVSPITFKGIGVVPRTLIMRLDSPKQMYLCCIDRIYGKIKNKIPTESQKNINPEDVTSIKLSLPPCGIGTCVIGFAFELTQYGNIKRQLKKELAQKITIREKFKKTFEGIA